VNTEQTDVGTLLDALRRDLNDSQLELLEQLLSTMRREVQQALASQGKAFSDITGLLSRL
jgi:Ni,Fe-hydrogenase III large subunit